MIKLSSKINKILIIRELKTLGDLLLLFREGTRSPQIILIGTGTYIEYQDEYEDVDSLPSPQIILIKTGIYVEYQDEYGDVDSLPFPPIAVPRLKCKPSCNPIIINRFIKSHVKNWIQLSSPLL